MRVLISVLVLSLSIAAFAKKDGAVKGSMKEPKGKPAGEILPPGSAVSAKCIAEIKKEAVAKMPELSTLLADLPGWSKEVGKELDPKKDIVFEPEADKVNGQENWHIVNVNFYPKDHPNLNEMGYLGADFTERADGSCKPVKMKRLH